MFSNHFLSEMLTTSEFDLVLERYTRRALNFAVNYSVECGMLRLSTRAEKDEFCKLIAEVSETIDLYGLISSWFLTWFANEFSEFDDAFKIFDFQLTEISSCNSPIYLAASVSC